MEHCDSLSTTYGLHNTSVSPIFMAAEPSIKENSITDRIIREVPVTNWNILIDLKPMLLLL